MAKKNKALPIITIRDEEKDSEMTLIRRAYIATALQGLEIIARTAPDKVLEEIQRLRAEIE